MSRFNCFERCQVLLKSQIAFRTFKKVPIEYSKKKNEKNTMTTSEIVINMFRA